MDINPTARSNAVASIAIINNHRESATGLSSRDIEAVEKTAEEVKKSHDGKVDVTV